MVIFFGGATLGTLTGAEPTMPPITPPIWPPGTPPGTPPTTPPIEAAAGGGASSSLMIFTFSGILVGVRSWPLTISLCTSCTTCGTAAAGGGGGGGGGGGATSTVDISACIGSASSTISGYSSSAQTITASMMKASVVVLPRLVFRRCADSKRLSSNIALSRSYFWLIPIDTGRPKTAPKLAQI